MSSTFASQERFEDLRMSDATKRAVRELFGYERLSKQQARYMHLMMSPAAPDVFVKAGTGSGKTLGFLIPAVEAIVKRKTNSATDAILVLVLSPTRELAVQTAGEATKLLSFQAGLRAASVTGGTDRGQDLRTVRTKPPAILVATPGRLMDLLEAEPGLLRRVLLVVLDEADRLLDPGFAPAVRKILATLPASHTRRTLLLTATVPPEVRSVATQFMRQGFEVVDASGDSVRNKGVLQAAVMCAPTCIHVELARVLAAHARQKVLVFFNSIALAELYASLFRSHVNEAWAGLLELHGGLEQNQRTRAMAEFKGRSSAVLFASDAAGRGIDVPNVSLVVQLGYAPPDVYQQRVGRTGRAGASGEAVILLGTDEARGLTALRDVAPSIQVRDAAVVSAQEHQSFTISNSPKESALAERAFRGALGAAKANAKALGWGPQQLVDAVAARILGVGMARVPEVSAQTLGKMGLRGVSFDTEAILRRMNTAVRG